MSVLDQIKKLNDGENFIFTYNGKNYEFGCYSISEKFGKSYAVREAKKILGQSMNVDKITSKYITLYDYNLFSVRSTYKIPVSEIELS